MKGGKTIHAVRGLFLSFWLISVAWAASENYKPEAFSEELLKKAEAGDAEAQCKLAGAYREGRGIEKNLGESLKWLKRSAEAGFGVAELVLAKDLIAGSEVPKDLPKAEQLLLSAEKKLEPTPGPYSSKVQYFLGMFYLTFEPRKDLEKALRYLRSAAEKNDSCAQHALGKMYADGTGVDKNETLALEYLQKSAAAEQACGKSCLAEYYLNRGEYGQAREWYEKAALQEEESALFQLGMLYRNGMGGEPDLSRSNEFFEKANSKGNFKAKYELGKNLKLMGNEVAADKLFSEISGEPLAQSDPDKNYLIAVASLEVGHFQKAKEAFHLGSPLHVYGARSLRPDGMKRADPKDPMAVSSVEILNESMENIGSGVLVGSRGKVLTAAHVVAEKDRILVRDADMRTSPVLGLWSGKSNEDLALLQTHLQNPAGAILSSRVPVKGDVVQMAGHPGQTVSVIFSQGTIHRITEGGQRACADAGAFLGFSGSGVFNDENQLVGIVISSGSESADGNQLGDPIPIHTGFESLPRLQALLKKSEDQSLMLRLDQVPALKAYGPHWDRKKNEDDRTLALVKTLLRGSPEEVTSAVGMLTTIAGTGNPEAQTMLGLCYSEGRVGPIDYTKAAEQFVLAANQGNSCAKHHLGMLYLNGLGVPQDDKKALAWLEQAAKDPPACGKLFLGFYYHKKRDFENAVHWYRLASELGDSRADAYLAEIRNFKPESVK